MSSGRFDIGSLDSYEEAKKCSVGMIIDNTLLDKLIALAKESPWLRMNLDLRNSDADVSQRMLNAIEPGSMVPIHRHQKTSETVVVCRGTVREEFYDDKGQKIAEFVLEAGGDCPGVQTPKVMYHTCVCLEPGSVIFEAKDRPYDPVGTEEVWEGE